MVLEEPSGVLLENDINHRNQNKILYLQSCYKTFHPQLEKNNEFTFALQSTAASNFFTVCCFDIKSHVLMAVRYPLICPLFLLTQVSTLASALLYNLLTGSLTSSCGVSGPPSRASAVPFCYVFHSSPGWDLTPV